MNATSAEPGAHPHRQGPANPAAPQPTTRIPSALIAHRLGAALGPENSLAACRAALRAGFRSFECDIKLSADGQAFLLHDDALLRTHGSTLRASTQPWAALRALPGEALPSLRELRETLRACADPTWVNLEIKVDDDAPAPLQQAWGQAVALLAAALWSDAEPPLLSSFSIAALQGARHAAPGLPRAWLCEQLPPHWRGVAQALELRALHLAARGADAAMIETLRSAGLELRVYTVNDPAQLRHWLELGASGVFTDGGPGLADAPAAATPTGSRTRPHA